MAVIPSGMGWSADENWMKSSTGVLGIANVPHTLDKYLPHSTSMPSNADIVLGNVYCLDNGAPRYFWTTFIGSGAAVEPVIVWVSAVSKWALYGYNTSQSTISTGTIKMVDSSSTTIETTTTYSSSTGGTAVSGTTYYRHWLCYFGEGHTMTSGKIPVFQSVNAADTFFKGSQQTSYKLNTGYAVASIIKWRSAGTTYNISAILMSTDPDFTVLSENGTSESPNYYTRSVSYSGMRFTMGMITTRDAENGTATGTQVPYRDLTEYVFRSPDELFAYVARLASLKVTETVDPYAPVGPSGEEIGGGDFDDTDDEIPMSTLPSLSFASTGFCRVYSPTLAQLSALATYMWTDQTFLQTLANHIIQLLESPMESIISLSLVPCSPHVGPAESVKVLFIPIPDVSMYPVTDQFTDVECGTLDVDEYYGSALDYNPYTKISCFLPFIGMVELDTDEVMGKTLRITYRIDVVSGACTAIIMANGDVLYQFSGHCSVQMPVTSADFSSYISALMSTAKLVAGLGASAAGAPVLGGAILGAPPIGSKSTSVTETSGGEVALSVRNPDTGRQVTAGKVSTSPQTKVTTHTPGGMNFGELTVRSTVNTVGAVMNSKAGVQHSGGFSGISGYLGLRYPYLIIKRPRLCNPNQYGQYNGRPSMIYASLGDCTGYTEVQSIQLTGIPATNPEMSEIAELLKSGVIL